LSGIRAGEDGEREREREREKKKNGSIRKKTIFFLNDHVLKKNLFFGPETVAIFLETSFASIQGVLI